MAIRLCVASHENMTPFRCIHIFMRIDASAQTCQGQRLSRILFVSTRCFMPKRITVALGQRPIQAYLSVNVLGLRRSKRKLDPSLCEVLPKQEHRLLNPSLPCRSAIPEPNYRPSSGWYGQSQALVFCLLLMANQVGATAIFWTNASGGSWSSAANWSPNQVPSSADDTFITSDGAYVVVQDADAIVASLTLGGSSGSQTLSNANYTLTTANAGVIGTNGTLSLAGGSRNGGSLTVNGTLNWTGGSIGGPLMGSGGAAQYQRTQRGLPSDSAGQRQGQPAPNGKRIGKNNPVARRSSFYAQWHTHFGG